jgi:hypothetical protein
MCSFELQEYGANGGKGWHSITEATGTPISKQESAEYFKPDRHYRVISRALEGEQSGRFIGVVWEHYEPHRGLLKKEEEGKRAPSKPKEVEDVIGEWVEKVDQVLAPVEKIMDTMDRIRERFSGGGAPGAGKEEGEGTTYQIPPPEFDGKLPAIMHPYVVHVIAEEIKGVIDYGATRIGEAFGVGGLPGQPAPKGEEEEEEVIPSLTKFKEKKKAVELPPEKEEEAEEELPTISMPKKDRSRDWSASGYEEPKPEEVPPIEEKEEEEAVPSLEEKPEETPKEEQEEVNEAGLEREQERLRRTLEEDQHIEEVGQPEGEEAIYEAGSGGILEELPSLPKKPRRRKKSE